MLIRSLVLTTCLLFAGSALAVDFRIETKVFIGEEVLPVSENTTLFLNGVIYDFAESPSRVAVFRHGVGGESGRFLLLAPKTSLRTEINAERVDAALAKLGQWAIRQRNPLLRFAANPQFTETYDEATGTLSLASATMTYKLATSPLDHPDAKVDLDNYLNWYAKLNCLLAPSMPPQARLEVNKVLARRNLLPSEVTLTLGGDKETRLRAEHTYVWRLSKEDRERIQLVGDQLALFREVTNEEFQAAEHEAAKVAAKTKAR